MSTKIGTLLRAGSVVPNLPKGISDPVGAMRTSDTVDGSGEPVKALRDDTKYRRRGVPIERVVDLAEKGLTNREIGKITKSSPKDVETRLKVLGYDRGCVEELKKHEGNIQRFARGKLLDALMDPEKMQAAGYSQLAVTYGILYDKERLERGQSTENVNLHILHASLAEIDAKNKELREKLKSLREQEKAEAEAAAEEPAEGEKANA